MADLATAAALATVAVAALGFAFWWRAQARRAERQMALILVDAGQRGLRVLSARWVFRASLDRRGGGRRARLVCQGPDGKALLALVDVRADERLEWRFPD